MKFLKLVPALLCIVLGAGCQTLQRGRTAHPPMPAPSQPREPLMVWEGNEVTGEPSIVISLNEQRAYFFKGKKQVGRTIISSGRRGFDTPPGSYRVTQKDKAHVSNLYGDFVNAEGEIVKHNVDVTKDKPPEGTTFAGAKMPYFMRFSKGYGLHAGRLPGYRASHGCVRLPRVMAQHYFENSAIGTPVTVEE